MRYDDERAHIARMAASLDPHLDVRLLLNALTLNPRPALRRAEGCDAQNGTTERSAQ